MSILEKHFLPIDTSSVHTAKITQINLQVDWFSSVLGRHVFCGNVDGTPCTVVLLDDIEDHSDLTTFPTMEALTMGAPEQPFMMFGFVKGKNTKRFFKIKKWKRLFSFIATTRRSTTKKS